DHLRMAMAGVHHPDAAGKIDIAPPFNVPHLAVARAVDENLVDLTDAPRDRGAPPRHQCRVAETRFPFHSKSFRFNSLTPCFAGCSEVLKARAVYAAGAL